MLIILFMFVTCLGLHFATLQTSNLIPEFIPKLIPDLKTIPTNPKSIQLLLRQNVAIARLIKLEFG